MRAKIKINSRILPIISVGMLFMQLLDPSPVWKALVTAFGGAWLMSFVWARSLIGSIQIEREIRFGWTQVGDTLEERFSLTNKGILPAAWVEIIDHSSLPGYSASRATGIEAHTTNTWRTSGICTRRGVYQLGGTTLRSGDPFGIYSVEIHYPESQTIVVTPPVIPLERIDISPAGWSGEGKVRSNMLEQTVSAVTVHEYQQGESLNRIHWPTTARRGKIFTRLLDGSPANDWWVVLDADINAQFGRDEDSTLELGVILAASLVERGLRARHSVGFIASAEKTTWLKPQTNEEHRLRIMKELAMLQPGHQPLAELLERTSSTFSQHTNLVIITSSLNPAWLTSLTHLIWKGITPSIFLIDASSFGSAQKADSFVSLLTQMNIQRFILDRSLLKRPEAKPGWQGQWEWRIMPTGKAVSTRPLGDTTWKKLG